MNFMYGTQLAAYQDKAIDGYKNGYPLDYKTLNNNMWVRLAMRAAPSNLTVRQLVLIDLSIGETKCYDDLLTQLAMLSSYGNDLFWAEGYSYWQYTRNFLLEYYNKFNRLKNIIEEIDSNFNKCGYLRNNFVYPAPFGDLRDYSCTRQDIQPVDSIKIANVIKIGNIYHIRPWKVGANTHTPKKESMIRISTEGVPIGFKFYQGYDKKYKNSVLEVLDLVGRLWPK